jgi:hypothetical protein
LVRKRGERDGKKRGKGGETKNLSPTLLSPFS